MRELNWEGVTVILQHVATHGMTITVSVDSHLSAS